MVGFFHETTMSPTAYVLYQHLWRQPDRAELHLEELVSILRSSKTAIRQAFTELEIEGLITLTREV